MKKLIILTIIATTVLFSFSTKPVTIKEQIRPFNKIKLVTDCGYSTETAARTCLNQHMQQLAQYYLVYDDLAMVVQERDANGNYTGKYCYEFYYDWHP